MTNPSPEDIAKNELRAERLRIAQEDFLMDRADAEGAVIGAEDGMNPGVHPDAGSSYWGDEPTEFLDTYDAPLPPDYSVKTSPPFGAHTLLILALDYLSMMNYRLTYGQEDFEAWTLAVNMGVGPVDLDAFTAAVFGAAESYAGMLGTKFLRTGIKVRSNPFMQGEWVVFEG